MYGYLDIMIDIIGLSESKRRGNGSEDLTKRRIYMNYYGQEGKEQRMA